MQLSLEELMSSAEDTLASHSVMPGSDSARKMTVISGQKCAVLSKNSGPLGSLVKTLLGTSAWASTMCFLTWTHSATPRKRLLFRLVPSTPHTSETEFGLLATPTKILGNNQRPWPSTMRQNNTTSSIFAMLPTPRKCSAMSAPNIGNRSKDKNRNLESVIGSALLPTPTSSDNRDRVHLGNPSIQRRLNIGKQINLSMLWAGQLNPRFVEQMMGFPVDWSLPD